jgi:hypothetical protein
MHVRDLLERKQHRKPRHINHDDMPVCNTCQKTYHTACINGCDGYRPRETRMKSGNARPHDLKEHPEHAKPSK